MDISLVNWTAVISGTLAAFALGMIWFGPMLFGRAWAEGSHGIAPPPRPPVLAMAVTLAGLFLFALVIGLTETEQAIGVAVAAIVTVAVVLAGMDLFSQKSVRATLIDAGYILACGVVMIAAQAIF